MHLASYLYATKKKRGILTVEGGSIEANEQILYGLARMVTPYKSIRIVLFELCKL